MSCYFRHIKDILDEAGIQVTASNRKEVDQAIHRIVGVDYKHCPEAWKGLKQQLANDAQGRGEIVKRLREAFPGS